MTKSQVPDSAASELPCSRIKAERPARSCLALWWKNLFPMSSGPVGERVTRLLVEVAAVLRVAPVAYGGRARYVAADYGPLTNKIYVSPDVVDQLTDFQLACVLAHELGHAHTRSRWVISGLVEVILQVGRALAIVAAMVVGVLVGTTVGPLLGLAVGLLACMASWRLARYGIVRARRSLRLWVESPADDFGVRFAGGKCEYHAVIQEVVQIADWKPDKLFHQRMARLAS